MKGNIRSQVAMATLLALAAPYWGYGEMLNERGFPAPRGRGKGYRKHGPLGYLGTLPTPESGWPSKVRVKK